MDDTYQGPTANQPKKCPLPRIGSKEWGWEGSLDADRWTTPLAPQYVIRLHPLGRIVYSVLTKTNGPTDVIGQYMRLRDAKMFAEARARRDWRKENGKR